MNPDPVDQPGVRRRNRVDQRVDPEREGEPDRSDDRLPDTADVDA